MATEDRLTHVDETGAARMVDVSDKDVTARTATATVTDPPRVNAQTPSPASSGT